MKSSSIAKITASISALLLVAACENLPQIPSLGGSSTKAAEPALMAGYLCCNVRTDGSWISDSNYRENAKRVIPVGTPVKVTSFGRSRIAMQVDGQADTQYLGNDYSRSIGDEALAKRYVVTDDPKARIAGFPAKVQAAIKASQLMVGMTQEQVVMAVGWPIADENQNTDARIWRYWLTSFEEYQVEFNSNRVVTDIAAEKLVKNQIVYKR
jgi:hypothetical protein